MEYAKGNHMMLEINEKEIYTNPPLLEAIQKNSTEIISLLIKYAQENHIILNKVLNYSESAD